MGETPLEGVAREELEQRLALALAVGDVDTAGEVEIHLAHALLEGGDVEVSRRHAERAVALQRERAQEHDLARALEVFGHACRSLDQAEEATAAYLEAVDLETRHGHRQMVASLLNNLGALAQRAGDRERARDLMSAALRTNPEARDDAARRSELALARMELEDGDDASAARRALRVLQGGATGELCLAAAVLLRDAGLAARRREDNEAARRRYELALPVLREQGEPAQLVGLLATLAATCRAGGDAAAARGFYEEALRRVEEWPSEDGEAAAAPGADEFRAALLHDLGDLALSELADPATAVGYLEQALVASEEAGTLRRSAEVLGRLVRAARALGDRPGTERWRAALERASFLVHAARVVEGLLPRGGVASLSGVVLGDTGKRPEAVRLPGGKLGDNPLWRRRLAAELRRAAPQGRVAVLFGGASDRLDDVLRAGPPSATAAPGGAEAVRLVLVEHDRVEERVARVERGDKGPTCERWRPVPAEQSALGGQRQRLVDTLRAALP